MVLSGGFAMVSEFVKTNESFRLFIYVLSEYTISLVRIPSLPYSYSNKINASGHTTKLYFLGD
jgi:hypothetical protein